MRLFSTKGKNLEDLDPSMFAKSKPGRAGKSRYEVNRFQHCSLLLLKLGSFIGIIIPCFIVKMSLYDDH